MEALPSFFLKGADNIAAFISNRKPLLVTPDARRTIKAEQ